VTEPLFFAKTPAGHLAPIEDQARELVRKMGDGEQVCVTVQRSNNLAFHRKLFALFRFAYQQWNPTGREIAGMPAKKSPERFRKDLLIAAGHYEVILGLDGEPRLEAKSLRFDSMDQTEREQVYDDVITVLTEGLLVGLSKDDVEAMALAVFREGF
jgi:Protein of unknown function (DUF1367)